MSALLQHTYISRTTKSFWFVVLNIQHTAHFIAIVRLETTIVKINIAHQCRIDKTQAFLLPAAYEVRTKNFKIVYINQVLIIAAATYIVLRCELIIRTNKNFY